MDAAFASLSRSLCRYHSLAPITYSVGERLHSTFTYAPTRKHERLSPVQTSGHVRGVSPAALADHGALGERFSYAARAPSFYSMLPAAAAPAYVVSTTAFDRSAFAADGEGKMSEVSVACNPLCCESSRSLVAGRPP